MIILIIILILIALIAAAVKCTPCQGQIKKKGFVLSSQ